MLNWVLWLELVISPIEDMNHKFMHGKSYFSNWKCQILLAYTTTPISLDQALEVFRYSNSTPKFISIGCHHFAFFNCLFIP
jgi:hypothetical protein